MSRRSVDVVVIKAGPWGGTLVLKARDWVRRCRAHHLGIQDRVRLASGDCKFWAHLPTPRELLRRFVWRCREPSPTNRGKAVLRYKRVHKLWIEARGIGDHAAQ
jgi:hypothetical protein